MRTGAPRARYVRRRPALNIDGPAVLGHIVDEDVGIGVALEGAGPAVEGACGLVEEQVTGPHVDGVELSGVVEDLEGPGLIDAALVDVHDARDDVRGRGVDVEVEVGATLVGADTVGGGTLEGCRRRGPLLHGELELVKDVGLEGAVERCVPRAHAALVI